MISFSPEKQSFIEQYNGYFIAKKPVIFASLGLVFKDQNNWGNFLFMINTNKLKRSKHCRLPNPHYLIFFIGAVIFPHYYPLKAINTLNINICIVKISNND